jgi:recombinational DNA repair protein RecT
MVKNEIAVSDDTVKMSLMGMESDLAFFSPAGFDVKSWLHTAAMCIMDDKKLRAALATDEGKMSLVHALKYGITTGVSLNPQEGKAVLIPFGNEIVFMVEKNGLCQMALDTGAVESVDADIVRTNDVFEPIKTGHGDDFKFIPARKDRGGVDGYFAFLQMKSGVSHVKYMTIEEIAEWRDTKVPRDHLYRTYDDKYNDPPKFKKGDKIEDAFWWKFPDAAGLKTVIRQLLQGVHIPTIDKTFAFEDAEELSRIKNVTPQKGCGSENLAETLAEKAEQAQNAETPVKNVTPPSAPAAPVQHKEPEKKQTAPVIKNETVAPKEQGNFDIF